MFDGIPRPHGGADHSLLPAGPGPLVRRSGPVLHSLSDSHSGPPLHQAGIAGDPTGAQRRPSHCASAAHPKCRGFSLGGGRAGCHGLPGGQPEPGLSLRHGGGQGQRLRLSGPSGGTGCLSGGDFFKGPLCPLHQDPDRPEGSGGICRSAGHLSKIPCGGASCPPPGTDGYV